MVTNGLFSSKLIYQICLWGGAEDYLLQALQKVQNKAARFVTKLPKETSSRVMLNHCGWLNVKQLAFYHSVILVQKTLLTKQPAYLYERLPTEFTRETILAGSYALRIALTNQKTLLALTGTSFFHRAIFVYYSIPAGLRNFTNMSSFKTKLKLLVKDNSERFG